VIRNAKPSKFHVSKIHAETTFISTGSIIIPS
jgi:hypothetical protein